MAYLSDQQKQKPLIERIKKIQEGDKSECSQFIHDYEPFIIKVIAKVTHRYIETENSEEYLVGIEAFHEAINRYDTVRGEFLKFAAMVITCRIRDFLRNSQKNRLEISLQLLEENQENTTSVAIENNDFTDHLEIKNELSLLKKSLTEFNISFADLIREGPKHRDTRLLALKAAKFLAGEPDLKKELFDRKRLPYSKILKKLKTTRKILSRNHKFIIAAVLILDSELELIKGYIDSSEGDEVYVI